MGRTCARARRVDFYPARVAGAAECSARRCGAKRFVLEVGDGMLLLALDVEKPSWRGRSALKRARVSTDSTARWPTWTERALPRRRGLVGEERRERFQKLSRDGAASSSSRSPAKPKHGLRPRRLLRHAAASARRTPLDTTAAPSATLLLPPNVAWAVVAAEASTPPAPTERAEVDATTATTSAKEAAS